MRAIAICVAAATIGCSGQQVEVTVNCADEAAVEKLRRDNFAVFYEFGYRDIPDLSESQFFEGRWFQNFEMSSFDIDNDGSDDPVWLVLDEQTRWSNGTAEPGPDTWSTHRIKLFGKTISENSPFRCQKYGHLDGFGNVVIADEILGLELIHEVPIE